MDHYHDDYIDCILEYVLQFDSPKTFYKWKFLVGCGFSENPSFRKSDNIFKCYHVSYSSILTWRWVFLKLSLNENKIIGFMII